MEIKILGTGCANCDLLEKAVIVAVSELNISAVITREKDMVKIISTGIMRTPGLVIDGKVAASGRLLTIPEIKQLIMEKIPANVHP